MFKSFLYFLKHIKHTYFIFCMKIPIQLFFYVFFLLVLPHGVLHPAFRDF